jgi:uncharacterized protein (DUF2164 family)
VEKLIENISRYLEARIELMKVDVQQKVAGAIVSGVQLGAIFFLVLFTVLFASVGLANYLNSVIGNSFAGYLIVAAFYLVLFFIVKASHKPIQAKVEKMTDDMFTSKKDEAHASDEVEVVVDRAPTETELKNGFGKNNVTK